MGYSKIQHLYNRFGFGIDGKQIKKESQSSFLKQLKKERPIPLEFPLQNISDQAFMNMSEAMRKEIRKKGRKKTTELNVHWVQRMMTTNQPIIEKMTLFWHHHFACIIQNPYHALQFNNLLREHSLGSFRELLIGVAKSAAMINFLHTRQNRKGKPNEDFARELCELFTLGRDNEYTEADIREIARAFTGWKPSFSGGFYIQEGHQDQGMKTIFGEQGYFGGEEAIDLILKKPACAYFVCENIYCYFVNPQPNPSRIQEMAAVFQGGGYDISKLIAHIATSDWFYEAENVGCRIKSPIEWLVGFGRLFRLENSKIQPWLTIQRILGQKLFQPPNVKGWKVDREWIDSNSLPLRMRLPSVLLNNGQIEMELRPDYDSMPNKQGANFARQLDFRCDWEYFFQRNSKVDYQQLFFNGRLSLQGQAFIESRSFDTPKEEVIQLMSLPEYQLM